MYSTVIWLFLNKGQTHFTVDVKCHETWLRHAHVRWPNETQLPRVNIVVNIWDNISTQVNKQHNRGLVIFRHSDAEFLHIISLRSIWLAPVFSQRDIKISEYFLHCLLHEMLLCRCCYYCVHLLCQICYWSTSRSRCIHSSSLLFVVYMKAKCRCSVGRTADVSHLCSCSHAVDMHWMYGPHLNTQDSPSTTASVLLLSLNSEPSYTLCTRRIPACSPSPTGLRDHSSSGRGYLQRWPRADPQWWAEGREYWAGRPHQLPDRRPCSWKMSHRQPWNQERDGLPCKTGTPPHDLKSDERRENKNKRECVDDAQPSALLPDCAQLDDLKGTRRFLMSGAEWTHDHPLWSAVKKKMTRTFK